MENKWWEYYAVRYFVGTVIGALIVALLNGQGSPFQGKLTLGGDAKEVTFLGMGLVAALGFAFCYVASAPVLVLHATRAHLRWSSVRERPYFSVLLLLGVPGTAAFLSWNHLPHWAAVTAAVIIGLQVGLTLLALFTKFSVIEALYRALAEARSIAMRKKDEPPSPGTEYVISYRHLREHGNAFAIVALEGVLASALYQLPSVEAALYFLGVWVLPATFAWIIGSVLESRFAASPLPANTASQQPAATSASGVTIPAAGATPMVMPAHTLAPAPNSTAAPSVASIKGSPPSAQTQKPWTS